MSGVYLCCLVFRVSACGRLYRLRQVLARTGKAEDGIMGLAARGVPALGPPGFLELIGLRFGFSGVRSLAGSLQRGPSMSLQR